MVQSRATWVWELFSYDFLVFFHVLEEDDEGKELVRVHTVIEARIGI